MHRKTCTFILLLLGVALPALSGKCPHVDLLPSTCVCDDEYMDDEVDLELSCSVSTLDEVNKALRLIDKNSRLEVHLDEMNLGALPSDIFDGWNVVKLDISHCQLDSLGPNGHKALVSLEDKLESLTIVASFNEENQPAKLELTGHQRLTHVDLSYNSITELVDFYFPTSITDLVLSNNGITKIGVGVFSNLRELEKLELHGNRFGPVERSMLPRPAHKLSHLELDNNALTDFPEDFFVDMPALQILALTNNGITRLPEKTFKPIWPQLELLDIRGNPIECDSSLKWMFHEKLDFTIFGTCEFPEDKRGKHVEDYIKSKGH